MSEASLKLTGTLLEMTGSLNRGFYNGHQDARSVKSKRKLLNHAETSFDSLLEDQPASSANDKHYASILDDGMVYHVCFLHHPIDTTWIEGIVDKLQAPPYGYKCCYLSRCHPSFCTDNSTGSLEVHEMIAVSQNLVIAVTSDLVCDMSLHLADDNTLFSELDLWHCAGKSCVALWSNKDCEMPSEFASLPVIPLDDGMDSEDWWSEFLSWLNRKNKTALPNCTVIQNSAVEHRNEAPNEQPETEVTYDKLINSEDDESIINGQGTENCSLVSSVRSHYKCFGREIFYSAELPDEFHFYQLQINQEDYSSVIETLMSSSRVKYHALFYNIVNQTIAFSILLCLFLGGIPLLEDKALFHGTQLGFEFVHGFVLWMILLTAYLIVSHFVKLKISSNLDDKLGVMNSLLVKSNLLCTLEELSVLEYNKLCLHFFYYEIGPCLAFIQDMLQLSHNAGHKNRNAKESNKLTTPMTNTAIENCDIEFTHQMLLSESENELMDGEEILLQNAAVYLRTLLSGRLRTPLTCRHVKNYACLCQYVELKLSNKLIKL